MAAKKNLKKSLEDELKKMLEATGEPSEGRMKLIALGIKMCALNAKLEESEFGEFFKPDDNSSDSETQRVRSRVETKTQRKAEPEGTFETPAES